jgi:hypothetical protein
LVHSGPDETIVDGEARQLEPGQQTRKVRDPGQVLPVPGGIGRRPTRWALL